jgi:hypothetical protein
MKTGTIVAFMVAIAFGSSLVDTGRISLFPQAEQQRAQTRYAQAADIHQLPQTTTTDKSAPIVAQRNEVVGAAQSNDAPQQTQDDGAALGIIMPIVQIIAAIVTAGATFVLARFARGQYRIYKSQLRISHKLARISSRQADIAEQAMTVTKQPQAFVKNVTFMVRGGNPLGPDIPSAQCVVGFIGETPATVIFTSIIIEFGQHAGFDGNIHNAIISTSTHFVEEHKLIALTASLFNIDEITRSRIRGSPGEFDPKSNLWTFFLRGLVVFNDVFGFQHEFGFCYRGYRGGGRGDIHGGQDHNYRRIRKSGERLWYEGPFPRWDGA